MTGLRLAEGLDSADLLGRAGPDVSDVLRRIAADHERAGRIEVGVRWRLTGAGFLFADGIAADFMAAIDR